MRRKFVFPNKGPRYGESTIRRAERYLAEKRTSPKPVVLTSKMWIFPDATIQPLDQWHWSWLQSNPGVYKKFGIAGDPASMDEGMGRKNALKVGFFRVAYEVNRGQLTIEGCNKHFHRRIKDAIFMLVLENASKIDHITVNLFNSSVSKLEKTGTEVVFRYDDHEKLNHIPFISESTYGIKLLRQLLEGVKPIVVVGEQ